MLLYAYKHVKHVRDPVVVSLPTDPDGYSHQLLVNLGIEQGFVFVVCLFALSDDAIHCYF